MPNFDITVDGSIDTLAAMPGYQNVPWTTDNVYVSEAATLSQTITDTLGYLYVVDIILGENSTNTALVKTGFLSITKPNFDLILVPATGPAPTDVVCPSAPSLTLVTITQETDDPFGRSLTRLEWTIPTTSELNPQVLGVATGAPQTFDFNFDPVVSGSERIVEISGVIGPTTLTNNIFSFSQNIISVANSTGFSAGDYIELIDMSTRGYYKIASVSSGKLTVETRCNVLSGFSSGATVSKVAVVVKTNGIDYTVNYLVGSVQILAGQFTPGKYIASFVQPVLQDLDHFELYRVPGDMPVTPTLGHSDITKDAVLAASGVVIVNDAIPRIDSFYADEMTSDTNGENWTYYLFSVDSSMNSNTSWASSVLVETIPSIPQNPGVTVGNNRVFLEWDALRGFTDLNTDGFNIYRVDGPVFLDASCIKVNSILISKLTPEFEDSANNMINRRPNSEVMHPQNGYIYSYKIESEDTITDWDVGTKNEDIETGLHVYTATKVP